MINPIYFNPIMFTYENYVTLNCFNIIPNTYEISNQGHIRYISTKMPINQHLTNSGYMQVNLKTIDGFRWFLVHRLVALVYCINYYNKDVVNHLDCDTINNNWYNLQWCTQKENIQFAIDMGNFKVRGEDNATSKLTENQVRSICKYLEQNIQYSKIIELVGLENTKQNLDIITKIRTGKLWKHVSCEYNIPASNPRSTQNIYTEQEINIICEYIQDGLSIRNIAEKMNIDISDKKELDRFWHFVSRIKNRKSYIDISSKYIW